jgi:transposase
MIPVPSGIRVWIATGHTDMRRGMNSLALLVQEAFKRDPHGGDLYVFRGKSGKLIQILWHDGLGMSLYAKRLERGRFIWPSAADGAMVITSRRSSATCSKGLTGAIRFTLGAPRLRVECDLLTHPGERSCESLETMIQSLCGDDSRSSSRGRCCAEGSADRDTRQALGRRGADRAPAIGDRQDEARAMFGPRSERSERLIDQLELQLEELAGRRGG